MASGMNTDKLRATLTSLVARSKDPAAPEGERKACAAALRRLRERHGPTVDDIVSGIAEESDVEVGVRYRHEWERVLMAHVAHHVKLSPYQKGVAKRWRKVVYVTGPSSLVALWKDLIRAHRKRLEDVIDGTICGYLYGAMELPEREGRADAGDDSPPLSKEWRAALRSGLEVGMNARDRTSRALPSGE